MDNSKAVTPVPAGLELTPANETEAQLLEVFFAEEFQNKIKDQLREAVQSELAGMSQLLREAIRNWVEKNKQNAGPSPEKQKILLMEFELETASQEQRKLAMENQAIKRRLQLYEHEAKLMQAGMQLLLHREASHKP